MKSASSSAVAETVETEAFSYDGLDEVLGFHLRQAQGAMHRRIVSVLAPLDLTQKQSAVLWLTGANPGASQTSVGSALRMDRATTMAIIDRLEARDLITRKRSRTDRRRQELYLTPKGQDLLVEVKALIAGHEKQFAARFSSAEFDTLISLLERLYGDAKRGDP